MSGCEVLDYRLEHLAGEHQPMHEQEGRPPSKGITYFVNTNAFSSFASDVMGPYPYTYTFIEPNYGDVFGGSYVGGSSQHPMDSVARGEALIKATYETIPNSPLWERSLLIITYDEHGGFYDSVQPGGATPPGDGSPNDPSINSGGFLFDWYGVRVPALIVSPLIPQGTVDHTLYDHASVPATLEALCGLTPMTNRDKGANHAAHGLPDRPEQSGDACHAARSDGDAGGGSRPPLAPDRQHPRLPADPGQNRHGAGTRRSGGDRGD
jgi:hypothetical protein